MFYKIFGLSVSSELVIEEAEKCSFEKEPDVVISKIPYDSGIMSLTREVKEKIKQISDDIAKLSYYNEKESIIHVPDFCYFKISEGKSIEYCDYGEYPGLTQAILCLCFPIILLQRKLVLLHGSGIVYKEKALLICGESGSGKSSLSHEIMKSCKKQLTDDIIAIDEELGDYYVYPSFPMRKLCVDQIEKERIEKDSLIRIPDEGREKYGLKLTEEYCSDKMRVGTLIIIEPREIENVTITEIVGAEKIKYLNQVFYRKDYFEQVKFSPDRFLKTARLANKMSIYVIGRPIGKMTVKEQAELIKQLF